jgi:hypothetical protein
MTSNRNYVGSNDGNAIRRHGAGVGILADREAGDFIDETIAVWQARSKKRLTREDGREIIANMTGFFHVLQQWDRAENAGKKRRKRAPA